MIDLANDAVALLQLRTREVLGVAVAANGDHLVSLDVEGIGAEAGHIGGLDDVEPRGRVPFGIEHAERLQDRHTVRPPGVALARIRREPVRANGKKAPGGADFVVSIRHMAGLARRRRRGRGENAVLLQQVPHAVLGGRVHLPLRMVEAHVAGRARLWLAGFLDGERVARVARVARCDTKARAALLERFDFLFTL